MRPWRQKYNLNNRESLIKKLDINKIISNEVQYLEIYYLKKYILNYSK